MTVVVRLELDVLNMISCRTSASYTSDAVYGRYILGLFSLVNRIQLHVRGKYVVHCARTGRVATGNNAYAGS